MSKNLVTALKKGSLKPKERVLLLVHNAVNKETTGKELLSEAEKHAISEGWQPINNEQVKEYNRYNQGWRLAGFAELDAQTVFMETKITYYQERQISHFLFMYPFYRDAKRWLDNIEKIKPVTIDQANEIVKKQREVKLKEGKDYEYATYLLAFESLDKDIQADLEKLEQEVAYEPSYLEEEEFLYNLLKGKKELTAEDKGKLTEAILKRGYNKFAKEWQLYHYFASIPLKEIGKRWIDKRGVPIIKLSEYGLDEESLEKHAFEEAKKEVEKVQKREMTTEEALKEYTAENLTYTLTKYAKDHKTTVEAELSEVIREWIDNGLLTEYEPLFKSTDTEAYNGKTKLPHNELFKIWLEAKTKAKETLDKLITEGKLKREGDTITGESLYTFKGEGYKFIEAFKERVDEYDANLGIVYADDDPDHKGEHLDRELLITDLGKDGKPHPINFSQMAIANLKVYINGTGIVKETMQDGERVIGFDNESYTQLMRDTTEGLKKQYAVLLAFRELFRRLSKTYNISLTYKIDKWIKETEGFIENHNKTIKEATKKSFYEIRQNTPTRLKEDYYIDIDDIKKSDGKTATGHYNEAVKEYFKELEETLGSDF
jgi:hypothetical protein